MNLSTTPFPIYLDFEYFFPLGSKKQATLVCASFLVKGEEVNYWLLEEGEKGRLINDIQMWHKQGAIFIGYNLFMAEARCWQHLGLDATEYRWVDLYLEYRLLTNASNKWATGKHYVEGKVIDIPKFKHKYDKSQEETEEENKSKSMKHNLVSCVYKLTGTILDSEHKTKMRDIILSRDLRTIEENREILLSYCSSDVTYLPQVWERLKSAVKEGYGSYSGYSKYLEQALSRGSYSALTAKIEHRGYPVYRDGLVNLTQQAGELTLNVYEDYHKRTTFIKHTSSKEIKGTKGRVGRVRQEVYSKDVLAIKAEIERQIESGDLTDWPLTEGGGVSTAHSAFEKIYNWRNPPKEKGMLWDWYLFLHELKEFSSITKKEGKEHILDNVSYTSKPEEYRVHPSHGLFGGQTGRSQAKATTLLHLKSSWMRPLVRSEHRLMVAIDYSQQELLVAGCLARDLELIEAYKSGDIYLAFAKATGLIPEDGTKKTHKVERDTSKSAVLGMQYGMEARSLARKIAQDTGRECTYYEAKNIIRAFRSTYYMLDEWKQEMLDQYREQGFLGVGSGWTMWGDQLNEKSVTNFKVQATGADMLRAGVTRIEHCQNLRNNARVLFTLHDAIYLEFGGHIKSIDAVYRILGEVKGLMRQASIDVLGEEGRWIRSDANIWGGTNEMRQNLEGKCKEYDYIYVEERGQGQYDKYQSILFPAKIG
jgi:hypothetical protein